MTLPYDPTVKLYGVSDPKKCFVFKSNVRPMKFEFESIRFPKDLDERAELDKQRIKPEKFKHSLIIKNGDDTR